jgi:hypothetical protein
MKQITLGKYSGTEWNVEMENPCWRHDRVSLLTSTAAATGALASFIIRLLHCAAKSHVNHL